MSFANKLRFREHINSYASPLRKYYLHRHQLEVTEYYRSHLRKELTASN